MATNSNSPLGNEVLTRVMQLLYKQTEKGVAKYGHAVDADNLTNLEWLTHAQEELIDALVYLECLKKKLSNK